MLVPSKTVSPSLRKSHGITVHCQRLYLPVTSHVKLLVLLTVLYRLLESERMPMGPCHQKGEMAGRTRRKRLEIEPKLSCIYYCS
ncbi:hypothetical protein Patl1_14831 [Pistacia atlantica]|uniref:Uncharacterized protein n=1 Tax=Pistacia atlantica TaxID=434234 RepID=A0ACC1AXS8_9ROSI|nr:hypothetical protein Patl1_14831 [Pistacia atlantica]